MAAAEQPSTATDIRQTDTATVRFDGSTAPDSAAIGYVVTAPCGTHVAEESYSLPYWAGSTQVEFDALLAALSHALTLGYDQHVTVYGDAESVIRLIDPTDPTTPNSSMMSSYVRKARAVLFCEFETFELEHKPREANRHADKLSNKGHDGPRLTIAP